MIGPIFALITVLLLIYLIIISFILYFKIKVLHKKKTGEDLHYWSAGINIWIAIFTNEYKEDKTYNKLVWQLRVLIPVVIILAIISGSLQ
jgi:hypothetical protein|tara:strand:+ start:302 stop:571 length:270 start_codon:yes stop_codon:yes gene_type:complete